MDKKFFIDTENFTNNNNAEINSINPIQITNDNLVNDFLNKNVSLESIIENEMFKNIL
ncbi:hypothetical protein [Gemella morbillorum]